MNYLDIKNLDTFSNLGSTDSVLLNKEDNSNFAGSITGDSLRKSLGVYGGIFNVTTCIPLSAGQLYTAETARAAVPIEPQVRQPGLTVKYKSTAGWIQETFIGNDINTWTDPANWITLESISTDISELDGRLTTAETRITQNANAIATKASVTSVDLLTNRMSLAESNITQTANDIATKVSTSTYTTDMNGVTTRLTTAESNITQNATNINLKVSKGDIISQINQSAEAITISASKIDLNGTVTFSALDTNTQNKINTAQTSANTANTNLSTLSSSLGALAYEDQVTLAKLDSTIIDGGYIKTSLIDANILIAKLLKTNSEGPRVEIAGSMINVFGDFASPNIRFGVNASGYAVLDYYDNNGNKLYNLGPQGIDWGSIVQPSWSTTKLTPVSALQIGDVYPDWDDVATQHQGYVTVNNITTNTGNTYYKYYAGSNPTITQEQRDQEKYLHVTNSLTSDTIQDRWYSSSVNSPGKYIGNNTGQYIKPYADGIYPNVNGVLDIDGTIKVRRLVEYKNGYATGRVVVACWNDGEFV